MGRLRLVSALALAFVPSMGARAGAEENVPDLLRRQTLELIDAITIGSPAVWERYIDAEARYIDESGTVLTKRQMVDGIKPLPEGISGNIQVTQFEAVVHGDVAVTTYVDDENEDYHGHKLHCQYRTTDTWKKTPEGWRLIAGQILALRTDPPSVKLPASLLAEYVGRYALTPAIDYEIRMKGGALEGQQAGRKAEMLSAEAQDVLFVPGRTRYRYVFLRGADGKITGFAQRREAWDLVWNRVPPAPKP
jgi:hypothetical protein